MERLLNKQEAAALLAVFGAVAEMLESEAR
jgi:hypothetical protein